MEPKIVLAFCLQIVYIKYTSAQCFNAAMMPQAVNMRTVPPVVTEALETRPFMPGPFTTQLTMQCPTLPAPFFSIFSDNLVVDGLVSVTGTMPFLGTVTIGGTVPTAGEGHVMYGNGNGEIGIVAEMPNGPLANDIPANDRFQARRALNRPLVY